jgi:hypothetical protein
MEKIAPICELAARRQRKPGHDVQKERLPKPEPVRLRPKGTSGDAAAAKLRGQNANSKTAYATSSPELAKLSLHSM